MSTGTLPPRYLTGFETVEATDYDHDVTISAGWARDKANTADIVLTAPITKQLDATWAAGSNAGGLFSGTIDIKRTYHFFVIKKDSDGSVDAGWDTDIDCANIPTGYTSYRRIRSHITDENSNIVQTVQYGDIFRRKSWSLEVGTTGYAPGATADNFAVGVPNGLNLEAIIYFTTPSDNGSYATMYGPNESDQIVQSSWDEGPVSMGKYATRGEVRIPTNTSGQIRIRTVTGHSGAIYARGWIDTRGRNDGI